MGGIMFKVRKTAPNRLDIELSGKLDSKEMQTALDALESNARGIENGIMLYDVVQFHIPSLEAIAIELARLPSMFGIIGKFRKAAVLTDKSWLQKISEFEGLFIPGLEIKAFHREQKKEAELWLSE